MHDLIAMLDRFNRKERYFLVKQTLGGFALGCEFRKKLECEIGISICHDAFTAMDYHLDWLAAALCQYECDSDNGVFDNPDQRVVTGTQRDVDLLVAFENESACHIVLIEAKAEGKWDNNQMDSKAERLKQIFGCDGKLHDAVKPHFCLMSPCRPQNLNTNEWPKWMRKDDEELHWIPLSFPHKRLRPVRCNKNRNNSAKGRFFRIDGLAA